LEYDGADVLQARYSHGEEIDQPLAMARDVDGDGLFGALERFFYHTDHLGSVRLVTDAAGAVANRYDYDAFGNIEEATSYETVVNPFGFTARERDPESGLMFYRARYYDPKIGRFISEDPIGFESGDINIYRYVFNSPCNNVDPSGLGIGEDAFMGCLAGTMAYLFFEIAYQLSYVTAYLHRYDAPPGPGIPGDKVMAEQGLNTPGEIAKNVGTACLVGAVAGAIFGRMYRKRLTMPLETALTGAYSVWGPFIGGLLVGVIDGLLATPGSQ
jgi:RHS repeat-associated protein